MKWDSERWRKLYRRVDAAWLRLPVLARGLGSELLKYAEDDGRIPVREDEETADAVCVLLNARRPEWKAVSECVRLLLADGFILRERSAILIRNFERAQSRSTGAIRQARYRARQRDAGETSSGDAAGDVTMSSDSDVTGNVTRDARVTSPVTGGVTPACGNAVTDRDLSLSLSSLDRISSDQIPLVNAGARDASAVANGKGQASMFVDPAPAPAAKRRRRVPAEETPLPEGWTPTESHRQFAARNGLNLETEVFGFRGWADKKTQASWNGAFSTWLANRVRWAKQGAEDRARKAAPAHPASDLDGLRIATGAHADGGSEWD